MPHLLRDQAKHIPDDTFVKFEDHLFTFAESDRLVDAYARGLAQLGVGPGTTVAVMMDNGPEFVWLGLAIGRVGGILVRTSRTSVPLTARPEHRLAALPHIVQPMDSPNIYGHNFGSAAWPSSLSRSRGRWPPAGTLFRCMEWTVRELAAEETYPLRWAVSADGRTDLVSVHHELDDSPGAWHLGAVDETGRVVAISSLYTVPCPFRPEARTAVQLEFMAVDPTLQRRGIGTAVMAEVIRRLKATEAVLLWANARDNALPFYERFGFKAVEGSGFSGPETGRPHHIIELSLGLQDR